MRRIALDQVSLALFMGHRGLVNVISLTSQEPALVFVYGIPVSKAFEISAKKKGPNRYFVIISANIPKDPVAGRLMLFHN